MAEQDPPQSAPPSDGGGKSSTAVASPKKKGKSKPRHKPPGFLPQFKVLLHNDDKNGIDFVVVTIMELTTLNQDDAIQRTLEAHKEGLSLLLVTHKERAELYKDQFESKGLTVTIEPVE